MSANRRSRAAQPGGFVMPVVLALTLVLGIVSMLMLARQDAQARIVDRQVRLYADTHMGRGAREVVRAWLEPLAGQPLEDIVAEDGHALDLEMPDGSMARVYIGDGQGSAMSVPAALAGQERATGQRIMDELKLLAGSGEIEPGWLRTVGPIQVSVNAAPAPVLEAVVAVVKGGAAGRRWAGEIEQARQKHAITDADLQTAASRAGLSAQERAQVNRLVTMRPELLALRVDIYKGKGASAPVASFRGLFSSGARQGGAGGAGARTPSITSLGPFLTWESVPVEGEGR